MLSVQNLSKHYDTPAGAVSVLKDVTFALKAGESAAIMGPSGCGKSTLLNALGVLEPPSSGTIELDGVNPYTLDEIRQAQYRNATVGFVFQDHSLLPQLSALENVLIPLLVGAPDKTAEARSRKLLDQVGLSARTGHRPGQLSGGEKQRVAIARALIRNPKLLLCDEPTGNLDPQSAESISALLTSLQSQYPMVLIVVTHSTTVAAKFGQTFRLDNGQLCASAS